MKAPATVKISCLLTLLTGVAYMVFFFVSTFDGFSTIVPTYSRISYYIVFAAAFFFVLYSIYKGKVWARYLLFANIVISSIVTVSNFNTVNAAVTFAFLVAASLLLTNSSKSYFNYVGSNQNA